MIHKLQSLKNTLPNIFRVFATLLIIFAVTLTTHPRQAHGRPQSLAQLAEISKHLVEVPMAGPITSLYCPLYGSIGEADLTMTYNEVAFVVIFPTGPRIYPQRFLVWHQVINELINDQAYAVTYCPITGTLMAYDASMQGLNLIFDVESHTTNGETSAFLYDGNSVLIDRNSGSLWLQETGMAFEGQLLGRGMPTIPVFWTSWGAAKKVFPNAPVLAKPKGRRPYGRDPYGSYLKKGTYYDNDSLAYAPRWMDRRFHRKTPMLGLEYDNLLLGIDINYVKQRGAVNFFLGAAPLLAVHDPELDVVRIFNRQVWAEPFLFTIENGELIDLRTRSVWSRSTGAALSGNLRGASMKQSYGVYSMWFAWYSLHPETYVIPGPGEVPANLLSPNPPGVEDAAKSPPGANSLPGSSGNLPGSSQW